jgi:putative FmdB family regulatory protein
MPIYAYRCSTCGHAKDVLQKMSDPVLTVCPACGASTFVKQVTAAGFQLKGSGWYVTDFRGGDKPAAKPADGATADAPKGDDAKPASAAPATEAAAKGGEAAPAPAPAAPAPAAPPSGAK